MGREARIKSQRTAGAAATAPTADRVIKLKDAHYWELDSRCRRTFNAQQNIAVAEQQLLAARREYAEAAEAQGELLTKLGTEYGFEPTTAQFGMNDKARTMTLIAAAPPAPAGQEKKTT